MAEGGQQVPGRPSDKSMCNLCLSENIERKAVMFCRLCDEAHCRECCSAHGISTRALKTSDSISSNQSLTRHRLNGVRAKFQKAFRSLGNYPVVKDLISNQFKDNKPANNDVVTDEHGLIENTDDNPDDILKEETRPTRKNMVDDLEGSKCSWSDRPIESHMLTESQASEHTVDEKPIDTSSSNLELYDKATGSSLADEKLVRHDVGERLNTNRLVDVMQVSKDPGDGKQSSNQEVSKRQLYRAATCNKQAYRNVVSNKPMTGETGNKQDNSQVIDERNVKKNEQIVNRVTNDTLVGNREEERWSVETLVEDGKKMCTRVADDKSIDGDLMSENVIEFDMDGLDFCSKHKKPLEMFCKSDGLLCCTVCVILDHKNCKSKNIFTIANVSHEMNGSLINHLMHCIDVMMAINDRLSKVETQLLSDMKLLPKKLKIIKKHTYDTFEESVMNEATIFQDFVIHTVRTKKQECDARINTLRTLLGTMCNVKKSGTPTQRFIVENQLKRETNTLIKVVKQEMKILQRHAATCSFESQFLNFRNRVNAERKACELNLSYVFAPMPILKLEKVAAVDLMNVEDISKANINDSELCYAGLDFLSDGRIVLLDKRNGMCLVYSGVLVYLSSKKLPYDHPSGVVVVTDDEIIITTGDNKKLVFVKINKSNEIKITGYCSVKEEYLSISVREEGDLLVSAVNSNKPIKILSKDGSECVDLDMPKKVCRRTAERNSTFVPDYDKAVWTDVSDDALYIYDIGTCTLISIHDKKIVRPRGVAVGPSCHILVCCEKTIVEMSLTGQVLSYHTLNLSRPCQICVNKDKSKLAVTSYENGNSKLLLYEINA